MLESSKKNVRNNFMHVSIILNIILFIRILPNGYILVGKIGN